MAKIRVYKDERDGESFPEICIRCGASVDRDLTVNFAWMPGWAHLFILAGLLPWLIGCLLLRKSMHVTIPVCRDHAGAWRNRRLFVWLGILFWLVYAIGLGAVWQELPDDAATPLLGFLLFGGLVWLLVAAIYSNSGLKPARITDRYIELVGTNKEFAREWEGDEPPTMRERDARRRAHAGGDDE